MASRRATIASFGFLENNPATTRRSEVPKAKWSNGVIDTTVSSRAKCQSCKHKITKETNPYRVKCGEQFLHYRCYIDQPGSKSELKSIKGEENEWKVFVEGQRQQQPIAPELAQQPIAPELAQQPIAPELAQQVKLVMDKTCESSNEFTVNCNDLAKYIKQVVAFFAGESQEKLIDEALDAASGDMKSFIEDSELLVFFVTRSVYIDENEIILTPFHEYNTGLELAYNKNQNLAVVFIKENTNSIDISKPISQQLDVIKFNSYKSIEARIEKTLLSYFESKDHLNQFVSKKVEEAIVLQNFDYTSIGKPTLQQGNPKTARVFDAKVKCEELVLEIGDIIWDGQLYREVRLKYLRYDEPKSDAAKKSGNMKTSCCPFSKCNVVFSSLVELSRHINAHFGTAVYQTTLVSCIFCKYPGGSKWMLKNKHLLCCQPCLSSNQIDKIIGLSNTKKIVFSDVRQLATAFWNNNFTALNINDFELQGNASHYMTCFGGFFKKMDYLNEFDQLINEWCKSGEKGIVYLYIEITGGIPSLKQLPECGRYVGSTIDYPTRSSYHNTFHMTDLAKTSNFYPHLVKSIEKEKRKFVRIKIVENIVEKHRYAVESATKRLIEGISPISWNCYAVSRPADCASRSWTYEKELQFAGYIFQRNWDSIKVQMEDNANIVVLKK